MPPSPAEVCRTFQLGDPVSDWTPVPGARSHTLVSLTTGTGRYAVKIFNPHVDHTGSPGWRDLFAEAVGLELAAWRAGLPLPRPIPATNGEILADIGSDIVRVHEWVAATPVSDGTADPTLAGEIGRLLAALHALPVRCEHDQAIGLSDLSSDEHIAELAARAQGRAWTIDREVFQAVRELLAQRAHRPLITTHRDLPPKNVLLTNAGTPVLVDWDVAGPWTAAEETAAAALEWSGVLTGAPSETAARALLDGYRSAGGTLTASGPEVFAAWLVKNANWTEMHIRHALDPKLPERQRERADQALPGLLDQLARWTGGVTEWINWL